ncbi:hypothetical protein BKP45_07890 [Anaerobacillus alkalidiazotrophicus]|uniref:Uncharacterized protein n=1 Tax=Anaerobacillus alkalidiazotrophicus TaxID=472963 RepID=A0A1S2M8P0_9BACI|nr:hypothetical protein BKP45_07890 [Anaerobacillus alkalidiazotrophicus]
MKNNFRLVRVIFDVVLPMVAWLLVIGSFVLQQLAETRMGLYRDLVYRNQILQSTILNPKWFWIYISIIVLVVVLCIFLYIKGKNVNYFRIRYLVAFIGTSIGLIILLYFYQSFHFLTFPLLVNFIMILFVVQFIKFVINIRVNK